MDNPIGRYVAIRISTEIAFCLNKKYCTQLVLFLSAFRAILASLHGEHVNDPVTTICSRTFGNFRARVYRKRKVFHSNMSLIGIN